MLGLPSTELLSYFQSSASRPSGLVPTADRLSGGLGWFAGALNDMGPNQS